jgi:large subunit ribosomal protein L22e
VPQKGKKPKRLIWKFNLDLIHPTEDGSFEFEYFAQFPWEKVIINGKARNLRNIVHIEYFKNSF